MLTFRKYDDVPREKYLEDGKLMAYLFAVYGPGQYHNGEGFVSYYPLDDEENPMFRTPFSKRTEAYLELRALHRKLEDGGPDFLIFDGTRIRKSSITVYAANDKTVTVELGSVAIAVDYELPVMASRVVERLDSMMGVERGAPRAVEAPKTEGAA